MRKMLTCLVNEEGYVPNDLVAEILHQHIQHIIVLLNCIICFRSDVLSKSDPYDDDKKLRICKAR